MKNRYNILITRSRAQAEAELREFENDEISFLFFPTIETQALPLEEKELSELRGFSEYDYIIFTSANAVKFFFEIVDADKFAGEKKPVVAATGSKTARALEKLGINPEIIPEVFSAEGLLEKFNRDLNSVKILIPGSKISRKVLREKLAERGADVAFVPIYDTVTKTNPDAEILRDLSDGNKPDAFVFTSPSSVKGYVEILKIETPEEYFANRAVIPIGDVTAKSLEKTGVKVAGLPQRFTVRDAAELAVKILRKEKE